MGFNPPVSKILRLRILATARGTRLKFGYVVDIREVYAYLKFGEYRYSRSKDMRLLIFKKRDFWAPFPLKI